MSRLSTCSEKYKPMYASPALAAAAAAAASLDVPRPPSMPPAQDGRGKVQGQGQGGASRGQDRESRATDRTEPMTLVEVTVSISQKRTKGRPPAESGRRWN
ncbi:hypothetical protein B0T20DRAFT_393688 [Sordaria brevicollis]|uniref:Uncharacterized protein n=1 Tax=Sordaria brevicollis TaxID=83679 RepID=A0AAE0PDB7_SORBR|nr:hypothetical protein B0T20DRAFT_393688 [Sordaria brevicollis]